MKNVLILTTSILAVGTAAYAGGPTTPTADPVVMQPTQPAPQPQEPLYSFDGLSLGLQAGKGWVDTDSPDAEGDGGLYGARAYYDRDFGNWIVGGGVQYDEADIDLDGAATVDSIMKVGPRAGYDMGKSWIYGTGGYAKAFTDSDSIDPGDSGGYYAGIGYERFLTENVTAGTEVVYHEFDDFEGDVKAEATTATVSLNYRF